MNDSVMYAAYFTLIETLHKRGVLSISDVVNSLGETADFRYIKKLDTEVNREAIKLLYEKVLEIEKALPAFRPQDGR